MRRALGLAGGAAKPNVADRQESPQRPAERFGPGHNVHKRRFVQDGEVPVTVVSNRRDAGGDAVLHRAPSVGGAPSRLEAAENALAHETAARHQAERALAEAQALVHDLQTKLGHAELARVEAVQGHRREQETVLALRAELRACEERLHAAEAQRSVRARRERVVQPAPAVVEMAEVADMEDDEELEPVAAPQRQPAARRGRPPGKKSAGRSRLVRWWIKNDADAE